MTDTPRDNKLFGLAGDKQVFFFKWSTQIFMIVNSHYFAFAFACAIAYPSPSSRAYLYLQFSRPVAHHMLTGQFSLPFLPFQFRYVCTVHIIQTCHLFRFFKNLVLFRYSEYLGNIPIFPNLIFANKMKKVSAIFVFTILMDSLCEMINPDDIAIFNIDIGFLLYYQLRYCNFYYFSCNQSEY